MAEQQKRFDIQGKRYRLKLFTVCNYFDVVSLERYYEDVAQFCEITRLDVGPSNEHRGEPVMQYLGDLVARLGDKPDELATFINLVEPAA